MRPPCELVQREFLPAFRSGLARTLYENGMSQNQIAAWMEITQAAVSKYLKNPVQPQFGKDAIDNAILEIVDMIESHEARQDAMVKIVCSTCMASRIGSDLCHRHRETVDSLGEIKCKICNELLSGQGELARRADTLEDMNQAVSVIEQMKGFVQLLPQVRASLVACAEDATSIDQVAGIPGRITDIKGRARAPADPEYGASQHTASLLLWAKENIPAIRACMCISGKENIAMAIKKIGFSLIRISEPASEVETITELANDAIRKIKRPRFAIQIPDGLGIEPVIYLFGEKATELASACKRIIQEID